MNALLRHTSNIHRGMFTRSSTWSFFGVISGNIKSAYTFVASGFSTTGSAVLGLIKSIKL